ncbi:MAG: CRISPR-associated endonuclease Cas2 [Candidatus Dojkabacteria bacterium]|nr:MAG: CRISPR-associated endonuclease Cas2 [Candidatus Dojkabacteria bacterium]
MILVTYDIADNKRRTRFSKFLKKFGHALQYSVYEIRNSKRLLRLVIEGIEKKHMTKADLTDHILVMEICEACQKKIRKYGAAHYEEEDVVYFD